jgi:Uma2 family endonuclease
MADEEKPQPDFKQYLLGGPKVDGFAVERDRGIGRDWAEVFAALDAANIPEDFLSEGEHDRRPPEARPALDEPEGTLQTDDRLLELFCRQVKGFRIERTEEGEIVIDPPPGGYTSAANSEISYHLRNWWHTHRRGRCCDGSVGFFLPSRAMRQPDGSWISPERLATENLNKEGLPYICPDFVVELQARTDRRSKLEDKMRRWINNGALVAWLIDPYERQVVVYETGQEPRIERGSEVRGSGPIEGFVLNAGEVWNCYE